MNRLHQPHRQYTENHSKCVQQSNQGTLRRTMQPLIWHVNSAVCDTTRASLKRGDCVPPSGIQTASLRPRYLCLSGLLIVYWEYFLFLSVLILLTERTGPIRAAYIPTPYLRKQDVASKPLKPGHYTSNGLYPVYHTSALMSSELMNSNVTLII